MHPHFRTSAFVLRLMFILPGLLATLPCVSSPSPQSTVSASPFAALESRAEAGDGVAQYDLAVEYLRLANPAAPDYRSALKWLGASATQGNVQAEFLLGYLYEHGEGTERDYAKAVENYQAAAIKGYAPPLSRRCPRSARSRFPLYQGVGRPDGLQRSCPFGTPCC